MESVIGDCDGNFPTVTAHFVDRLDLVTSFILMPFQEVLHIVFETLKMDTVDVGNHQCYSRCVKSPMLGTYISSSPHLMDLPVLCSYFSFLSFILVYFVIFSAFCALHITCIFTTLLWHTNTYYVHFDIGHNLIICFTISQSVVSYPSY